MSLSAPAQLTLGFAENGTKNTIPNASQIGITPGAASFNDGFPPVTRQPVAAGGVPPFGEDMNGVLYQVSKALQWEQAGGRYVFASAFATAVGGYPLSGVVQSSDGLGSWLNTTANNTNDPEAVATPNGWQPVGHRAITSKALSNANITLTNLESARETIAFTGTLTGNVIVTVAAFVKDFKFVNQTTGAFTVSVKTATGGAFQVPQGGKLEAYGDGATLNVVYAAIAGAVVGAVRNLASSVAVAAATKTVTADEIIVETALGGIGYKLANFTGNGNLGTTGINGMDTGLAPVSGYVAEYAAYNPSTGAKGVFYQDCTSIVAGNIYGGANAPAGYTATALISVWPTNASRQFIVAEQYDRQIDFPFTLALSTSTAQSTATAASLASFVPKNAKSVDGVHVMAFTVAAGTQLVASVYSTSTGVGIQSMGEQGPTAGTFNTVTGIFRRLRIPTQQTMYYTCGGAGGSGVSYQINLSGYSF